MVEGEARPIARADGRGDGARAPALMLELAWKAKGGRVVDLAVQIPVLVSYERWPVS